MSATRNSVLVVWCKTSFTFPCSKDFLRITDGVNKIFGVYCGNKTGQNLLVTGDKVQIIFHSDDKIERRGYLLNFTLVSPASISSDSVSKGKWDHKEEAYKIRGIHQFLKCISTRKTGKMVFCKTQSNSVVRNDVS